MATTNIEWTRGDDGALGQVWNPTTGCDKVSPGCGLARYPGDPAGGCYALAMARRLKAMGQARYQRDGDPRTSGPGFGITEHPEVLDEPLHWRKPRRVFVNSMSDLFHDGVSEDFIARVWATMALTPRHTFQVLTKRHARMRALLAGDQFRDAVEEHATDLIATTPMEFGWRIDTAGCRWTSRRTESGRAWAPPWPLPNVWLGVSAEDQKRAALRLPALLATASAVRFVSCEPLLGPVDLRAWLSGLDWVIAGGESGPQARPLDPDWLHSLGEQCANAGVALFVKQLGTRWARHAGVRSSKGSDPGEWPAPFPRHWPTGPPLI